MSNAIEEFKKEVEENIRVQGEDKKFQKLSKEWLIHSIDTKYSYNFRWMGRPIIQYPQDIMAMQEIIWDVKPDLIVETGIAHGGSLIFYASMISLLGEKGHVLGVDIDIREHNKREIEVHPMCKRITMLEGSSVDDTIVSQVHEFAKDYKNVLVVLDSCHTHQHVLEECRCYSDLVKKGSYLVVMDTVTEMYYEAKFESKEELTEFTVRPWGLGNNSKTGVEEFLKENDRFMVDERIDHKLILSVAPSGYLRCIK